jgi:hypothetical protein
MLLDCRNHLKQSILQGLHGCDLRWRPVRLGQRLLLAYKVVGSFFYALLEPNPSPTRHSRTPQNNWRFYYL